MYPEPQRQYIGNAPTPPLPPLPCMAARPDKRLETYDNAHITSNLKSV